VQNEPRESGDKPKRSSTSSLIFSTLKMALATFSSRILGLVREQVMAANFGASGLTDAFTVAYRVPNMLRDLFAEGAFSSAFVPVFTKAKIENEKLARTLLWSMAIILGLITLILSGLIMVFAPEVVLLMTDQEFTADPQRMALTVQMVRIMAPFLTLISLAALFMGALNTIKIFFVPALAPAAFNIIMIASMLTLPPVLMERGLHPILSLAIGVIGGGLIQLFIQIPLIIRKGLMPTGEYQFNSPWTQSILKRLGIGTFGIAATQVNILITTILATGTQLGAVSWLTYAFRLFQFPVGILSVSIAGSNLVHFSEAWKKGDEAEAKRLLKASYDFSWLVIIPALALMMALSKETVNLIFERGAFSSADSLQTALALKQYLWGLPFYGLYKIFAPTFFSIDQPKVPVIISMVAVGVNIIFCVLMVPKYGFWVLALGTSLSMMFNCTVQGIALSRYLRLGISFFFDLRVLKFMLCGVACFFMTQFLKINLYQIEAALWQRVFQFSVISVGGIALYAFLLLILGEGQALRKLIKKK
jgi:putative peptidoglycan lipid II flippase